MQAALSQVADEPVSLVCAGRTDTGVHALCQVAHFDSESKRSERSWVLGTNSNLPKSACVHWVREVPADFHARFSALARHYRYVILNRWVRPALDAGRVTWCRQPLDAGAMDQAARLLEGEHDFSSFRSSGCSANHAIRTVQGIRVLREGERVVLDVSANGFLYRMVRNIAGSLMQVGSGERDAAWLREVLEQRDRRAAGATAGPEGLYFTGVRYPVAFGLPSRADPYPEASGLA